jgi:hypothetical protein
MPSCMHRKPLKSLVYTKFRILPLRLRWLFKSLNRYLDSMNMWFIWWPGRTTTLSVLFMTTAHWPGEAQKIVPRDLRFRHHIPEDFVQLDSENNQILPFSRAVVDYNLHMGGSRRKCSAKGTLFLRQTSMSTLLMIPVSVSFRCSCSECLHPLQAHLFYKQNDTRSISEGGDYFADAKSS